MAHAMRVCYLNGPFTLLKPDGSGHETPAKTRGRIMRAGDAVTKHVRTNYGLDFRFVWVKPHERPYVPISVGRKETHLGGGYYGRMVTKNGREIWITSFLAHDPFRDPLVFGRLLFHEVGHLWDFRLGGDKWGHARTRADIFHLDCGSQLLDSLKPYLSRCGRIPGWKPPRIQKLIVDDPIGCTRKGFRL